MAAKSKYQSAAEALSTAVMQHVVRYRITVLDAVTRLPAMAGVEQQDIRRTLASLKRSSLLASAPLCYGQTYWHLTPAGAKSCGLPEEQCGPLSEPAKIRAYAMLHFCCLRSKLRHRLATTELSQHFPELHRAGLPSAYFFDPEGAGRLGLIRVDAGGRGRWDRVIESLREDVSSHIAEPGFRKLISAGRFQIAVLTVFPEKARRIEEALAAHPDARRVPIQVVPIPELLPIVTSTLRKEVPRHTA